MSQLKMKRILIFAELREYKMSKITESEVLSRIHKWEAMPLDKIEIWYNQFFQNEKACKSS